MDQARKLTAYPQTAQILIQQVREAHLDHDAFHAKIRSCELSRCRATCCHDGVYLSREESEGVAGWLGKHRGELVKKWEDWPSVFFEGKGVLLKTATRKAKKKELAVDYPSHFAETRCAFLDGEGRCQIQRLDMEQGNLPWYHKPLTCWIHPILIQSPSESGGRPIITLPNTDNDPQSAPGYPGFGSCTHCGREDPAGEPAFEVLRPELSYLSQLSGRNLCQELEGSLLE